MTVDETLSTGHNDKDPGVGITGVLKLCNCREVAAESGKPSLEPFSAHLFGQSKRGVSSVSYLTKTIPVGRHVSALVDAADYSKLSRWTWYRHTAGNSSYAMSRLNVPAGRLVFMHRLLLDATGDQSVRHVNGNGLDNRRANLALSTFPVADMHRLTIIDAESRSAVCAVCGPVIAAPTGLSLHGVKKVRYACPVAKDARRWRGKQRASRKDVGWITGNYRKYKGGICERCGFIAAHPIQLEIHHKDHNHSNNLPANLETVCCNCHRLQHSVRWFADAGEAA